MLGTFKVNIDFFYLPFMQYDNYVIYKELVDPT